MYTLYNTLPAYGDVFFLPKPTRIELYPKKGPIYDLLCFSGSSYTCFLLITIGGLT